MKDDNMTDVNGLCTGKEKLDSLDASVFEMKDFTLPFYAHKATLALAQALHDLLQCKNEEGPFRDRSCADPKAFKPWQMFHYVKNVRLKSSTGSEFVFDSYGDSQPLFDLLYWHMTSNYTSSYVKVGTYNGRAPPGSKVVINASAILWGGKYSQVLVEAVLAMLRYLVMKLDIKQKR
ncbi:hypothetical protein NDU88_000940 [Pleurodeles waltl]|uniref:Receptor ligand binding region domain-containing protein n=1 Tax=Pleurodeles waltl TaxID=8319 RepID=A0AAV7LY14_PLEWA|nr:hypothetical protein NDU88_000940 [Pleurodeles waltl]